MKPIDVTDKWHSKTVGGHEVIRVEQVHRPGKTFNLLSLLLRHGIHDAFTHKPDGTACLKERDYEDNRDFDLIPVPPPKSPWDGFPLDHWWRRDCGYPMIITSIDKDDEQVVVGGSWKSLVEVQDRYEHTADPINGEWEKGWGQS